MTVRRAPDAPLRRRSLRWRLGLSLGVMSNFGALTTPRITLETSLLLPLWRGWIGPRIGFGLGWASQDITSQGTGAPRASSSLVLLPIALGAHYELPFGRLSPYATLAFLLHVIASKNAVEGEPERTRVDVAVGLLALGGCSLALGPGAAFFEMGWQQSRIDNDQVRALAGGLVISGGFRLELR